MVDCVIKGWQGADAGTATLDLQVAKEENAAHIVHRAVIRQMHNSRQGTLSTKTRSEVRGVRKVLDVPVLVQIAHLFGVVAV